MTPEASAQGHGQILALSPPAPLGQAHWKAQCERAWRTRVRGEHGHNV